MMRLQILGHTPPELASMCHMTIQQVMNVTKSPLYVEELNRLTEEANRLTLETETSNNVRKFLLEESVNSLNTIRNLRDSSVEDGVKLRAATEILDRAGYTQKKEGATIVPVQINITQAQQSDLEKADGLLKQSIRGDASESS